MINNRDKDIGCGFCKKVLSSFKFTLEKLLDKWSLVFFRSHRFACEIKEFNLQSREVLIHCYGVRIIIIKSSISKVITDPNIVVNLSSNQASWLGYYYGKLYTSSQNDELLVKFKNGGFFLRISCGRYKMVAYNNKILTYTDIKTNKIYKGSPISIFQNNYLISQFDPSQACYIGMLVGLIVAKQGETVSLLNRKPTLTIVNT